MILSRGVLESLLFDFCVDRVVVHDLYTIELLSILPLPPDEIIIIILSIDDLIEYPMCVPVHEHPHTLTI